MQSRLAGCEAGTIVRRPTTLWRTLRGLARSRAGSNNGGPRPANVLFVSHCDFTGNSALHVLAIANELAARGLSPAICDPGAPGDLVDDLGRPSYPLLSFVDAERKGVRFPDGRGPDLVHAFTPREHVRRLTTTLVSREGCPYVVHLEDNEEAVLAAVVGAAAVDRLRHEPPEAGDAIVGARRSHPGRAPAFLEHAAGVTALLDTLLELKPASVRAPSSGRVSTRPR